MRIRSISKPLRLVAAMLVWVVSTAAARPAQRGLEALTVPSDRLPRGCQLTPPPDPTTGGSAVVIMPAMLSRNPWIGDDRPTVATIHSLVDSSPRLPDGPPLDARRATQYALKWADGVRDAYRAGYVSEDLTEITVYAVRLENGTIKTRVFARDNADRCVQAVRAHVQADR